jgi:peptidoglycan/LPS O-acetylase OafA/YrhL
MNKPQKLDTLTSLRFFAAAMIVIGHFHRLFGSMGLATTFSLAQGVSFFFVLSGFILTYNYPVLATKADVVTFFKARIARIWPAHIAAIGLLILLTANMNLGGPSRGAAIFAGFANIFLFQSLVPLSDVFLALNGVAWSISTEMFFYFAFPLLIADTYCGWKPKLSLLILIAVLHLWFATVWSIPSDESVTSVNLMGLINVNPLVRLFEFFMGVLACTLFMHLRSRINYSVGCFTVLEVAIVMLTLFSMHFSHRVVSFLGWQGGFANVVFYYLTKVGSFWVFAPLIIIFAFGKGLLSKVLTLKPMILLGEISFALYLVHMTVLKWYEINILYFQDIPEWSKVAGCWLLSLLIAYLLHKIVEIPCRKLITALPKVNTRETFRMFFTGRQSVHVAMAMAVIVAMINGPLLIKIKPDPPALYQVLTGSHLLSTPASFSGFVDLSAVSLSPFAVDGEDRRLDLLFNVQSPLPNGYLVAVHIVAADGSIIHQTDFPLVKARGLIKGERWIESIKIPAQWLKQAKGLGIAIYSDPKSPLTVTYPRTDYDGRRALIDFSQIF